MPDSIRMTLFLVSEGTNYIFLNELVDGGRRIYRIMLKVLLENKKALKGGSEP